MMPNKEQEKAVLTPDKLCILTYLITGGVMLSYADSIPKIMISGIVLLVGAFMYHIVYIRKKHLVGDLGDLNE